MEAAIIGNISNIELVFRTCQNSKFNNAENKPIKKIMERNRKLSKEEIQISVKCSLKCLAYLATKNIC